jgi:hypothetical protein
MTLREILDTSAHPLRSRSSLTQGGKPWAPKEERLQVEDVPAHPSGPGCAA